MKQIISLFTLALLVCLGTFASAQIPSYVPTNGLAGWWPFNGNANDESGNGNHGTVNGATLAADRFGNAGKAYSFMSNNNIRTNYFGIPGSGSRTISFFMKNNSLATFTAITYGGYSVSTQANAGTYFEAKFNYGGTGANADNGYTDVCYNCHVPVNNNQWNHYVWVLDSIPNAKTSDIKIFQNGILLSNVISTFQPNISINTFCGINPLIFGKAFVGELDDIAFYNRALTPQEITNLYQGANVFAQEIQSSALQVYPKPANHEVTLQVLPHHIGKIVTVVNTLGQNVLQTQLQNERQTLSLEALPAGVYTAFLNDDRRTTVKLIKE